MPRWPPNLPLTGRRTAWRRPGIEKKVKESVQLTALRQAISG
jgi:hypothetical protein